VQFGICLATVRYLEVCPADTAIGVSYMIDLIACDAAIALSAIELT
jgi:hypothetical protein